MKELDHNQHRYEGEKGEQVTVTLTPHDTTALVDFVLDGAPAQALPPGTPLRFTLGNQSGDIRRLQLTMDFDAEGSYDITVATVDDCSKDPTHTSCTHTRNGPPRVIENHTYITK